MKNNFSYSYLFHYLEVQFSQYKIVKLFELQIPVKEIVFSSIDKKNITVGDVERFILKAIQSLERVTISELEEIYHLGKQNISIIFIISLDKLIISFSLSVKSNSFLMSSLLIEYVPKFVGLYDK